MSGLFLALEDEGPEKAGAELDSAKAARAALRPSCWSWCVEADNGAGSDVRFRGQSGHHADALRCLLLTQSEDERLRIGSANALPERFFPST